MYQFNEIHKFCIDYKDFKRSVKKIKECFKNLCCFFIQINKRKVFRKFSKFVIFDDLQSLKIEHL